VTPLRGQLLIESRTRGRWVAAPLHAGAVGVTPPGQSDTLRWRMPGDEPRTTLHLHVPAELLDTTRAEMRSAPDPADLNALGRADPVASAIMLALHAAMRTASEPVVAETLAQALAAHLLAPSPPGPVVGPTGRTPKLSPRALQRVTDYMRQHLHEQIALDDLAREAHLSKFHFLRAFKATVGTTPHRHLTGMRMNHAATLLAARRHTVSAVAAMCGYASVARFTTVFRQHFGITPGAYQRL
jgi:AraC family transcriptional regulator